MIIHINLILSIRNFSIEQSFVFYHFFFPVIHDVILFQGVSMYDHP